MSTTDPAVTAAAEALAHQARALGMPPPPSSMEQTIGIFIAAVRPVIEAEVRQRIAAEIREQATKPCDDFDRGCACGRCESHEDWTDAARIAEGGTA